MNEAKTRGASVVVTDENVLDALVIGGGVTGIYALYRLQELGINVQLVDKASGLGGTWFWNRYPGARFDSDSYSYAYFFSEVLADEWEWTEHYASQPEIEKYFNFVVDRFDLRKNVRLNSEVTAATFDRQAGRWLVDFADGRQVQTRFLVPATGMLSEPIIPSFEGFDDFQGVKVHTGLWPAEGIELAGKRVAIIGTGSSGVQLVTEAAKDAASVTVFQRNGHWVTPLNNRLITPEETASIRARFAELQEERLNHFAGFLHEGETRETFSVTEEERLKKYEDLYNSGGLRVISSNFVDTGFNPEANKLWSDFVADKIRARIHDKDLAERLIPKDHGFGEHRPPKDTGYYEVYNQENVHLVCLLETPIERFTETGIQTTTETFDFDVIVFATGFEAWLGALRKIDIRNDEGLGMLESWEPQGPKTMLGIGVPGFPNLLFVGGLHSLGGNLPAGIEPQVDWVADLIRYVDDHGYSIAETTQEAAEDWTREVYEACDAGPKVAKTSWFAGGNIPGRNVKTLLWMGGIPAWREKSAEIADSGYKGLTFRTIG